MLSNNISRGLIWAGGVIMHLYFLTVGKKIFVWLFLRPYRYCCVIVQAG